MALVTHGRCVTSVSHVGRGQASPSSLHAKLDYPYATYHYWNCFCRFACFSLFALTSNSLSLLLFLNITHACPAPGNYPHQCIFSTGRFCPAFHALFAHMEVHAWLVRWSCNAWYIPEVVYGVVTGLLRTAEERRRSVIVTTLISVHEKFKHLQA